MDNSIGRHDVFFSQNGVLDHEEVSLTTDPDLVTEKCDERINEISPDAATDVDVTDDVVTENL